MKKKWLLVPLLLVSLPLGVALLGQRHSGPQYPQYCWLAFGPRARKRVLVRFDGKTLAIDLDGDGKFDGKGEQFTPLKECLFDGKEEKYTLVNQGWAVVPGEDDQTSYLLNIGPIWGLTKPPWTTLSLEVAVKGPRVYDQQGLVAMTPGPQDAPVVHFDGPLTVQVQPARSWLPPPDLFRLQKGDSPADVRVMLATVNANGQAALRVHDDHGRSTLPEGVYPFADVEFPPRRTGDPSIKRRYALDKVC